jgi:NADH:ubiquinone oxidoreductase subunit 5 (subunit L)/multisubunit Na+/H+ antiporter MnhA subunit
MLSSSITLIASSYWAFSQFDLKKIIALSTTSQLRFIFLMISMGYIELAYLHMLFHGYFKAMLFIGRGVRIHSNSSSSQDLRNLSNSNRNPYLMVFFFFKSLGLMGIPFFGGF